eukprot:scaffold2177_cov272-Pinguiococcus_pyrenoidosus.AAC.11
MSWTLSFALCLALVASPGSEALLVQRAPRRLAAQWPLRASKPSSAELSGQRFFVNFACFGYADRYCTLTLGENGLCEFADGLKAGKEPGPWRVEEEEDGQLYLQMIMPAKDIYRKLYNIPGDVLFWRAQLERGGDGGILGKDGKIISEKKSLLGLKTDFVLEGTFSFEPLTDQLQKEPMKSMLEKVEELRLATGQDKKAAAKAQKAGKQKKGKKKGMGA